MTLTKRLRTVAIPALALTLCAARAFAQTGSITVQANHPEHAISPTLYGLMTEEINHSYDGGLYAELIRNRIFRNNEATPVHWHPVGNASLSLNHNHPYNKALTTCLKVQIEATGRQPAGIANSGYWGIPVKPNTIYHASFYARAGAGASGTLTLAIQSSDGSITYASAHTKQPAAGWHKYTATLKTGSAGPTANTRFVILASHPATLYFNLVSLFPPTYLNQPNGFRPDLMKLLGAMHPAFLRLPGGNYLEGNTIAERFRWKKTLGPLTDRPGHESPWGYRSTDGMGLLEFLMWCQDLHMQPVLAVYAGYSLQQQHIEPGADLEPFVKSALEEIQFTMGAPSTPWGRVRAQLGHPAPFPLHYVEVGNEDFFDQSHTYNARFAQFFKAIKAKYPQLKLIATTPVTGVTPDLIDDHYYRSAAAMENDVHHYDHTSRSGPKTFVGEWASTEGHPTPTMNAALGDAAWLTGLEKNSDQVIISSYAPLLVNVNNGAAQWGTNLIGYNALTSFGSPSYYVQKMFSTNRGDVVLPETTVPPHMPAPRQFQPQGGIGVGTWNTEAEFRSIQVTHNGQTLYSGSDSLSSWNNQKGAWMAQNGAIQQTSPATNCVLTTGSPNWTDYTYTLQAKKLGGREGFLILFHVQNRQNWVWWNIGGWGNTRTALNRSFHMAQGEFGTSASSHIDTGKWYNIKVHVHGTQVECYLDGKLILQGTDTLPAPPKPVYTEASRVLKNGDVILKVVNVSAKAIPLQIHLRGVRRVTGGSQEVLSGSPDAQNSIENPRNVVPVHSRLPVHSPNFMHTFPAHSVSVLRIKTR